MMRWAMPLDWIRGAIRQAVALVVLCALNLAPIIIAATHGSALPSDRAQITDILLHGHSHDDADPDPIGGSHDATDHEHQTQMVLTQSSASILRFSGLRLGMSDVFAGSLPPSGPRRPPKDVLV